MTDDDKRVDSPSDDDLDRRDEPTDPNGRPEADNGRREPESGGETPGFAARVGRIATAAFGRFFAGCQAFRAEANIENLDDEILARRPARPSEAAEQSTAGSIANTLVSSIAGLVVGVTITLAQIVPGTTAFFKGLLRAGYRGLHKKTGADAIMHVADGNRIKHVPVHWDHEKQRYELAASDDEPAVYWNAASEGRNEYRTIGNVPAVWAAAEANELGSHVQAEVAEALDIGAQESLVKRAEVQHVVVEDRGDSPAQAVADGGVTARDQEIWEPSVPDTPADVVVPIGNSATGDTEARGNVVSMQKYYETYPSVADSEEMKQQEMRGRLAAEDEDLSALAQRMLLIAGAIVVLSIAAFVGLPILLGGGGGSGGSDSFIPLVTSIIPTLLGGV